MPELGEIKNSRDLGYKTYKSYIYAACDICGRRRWVELLKGKPRHSRCNRCAESLRLAKRICLFCHKPVWRGRKVTIYSRYGTVRGIAHTRCLKEYHDKVELGEVSIASGIS